MATEQSLNERMRALPKVDEVVGLVNLSDAVRACVPETAVTDAVRASIQAMRRHAKPNVAYARSHAPRFAAS